MSYGNIWDWIAVICGIIIGIILFIAIERHNAKIHRNHFLKVDGRSRVAKLPKIIWWLKQSFPITIKSIEGQEEGEKMVKYTMKKPIPLEDVKRVIRHVAGSSDKVIDEYLELLLQYDYLRPASTPHHFVYGAKAIRDAFSSCSN